MFALREKYWSTAKQMLLTFLSIFIVKLDCDDAKYILLIVKKNKINDLFARNKIIFCRI